MINKKERMRKKIMKANNVKRVLTTILAATLAATSVTACGSGSSNTSADAAGNHQIGVNNFSYNAERAENYLYSVPYDEISYVFVYKNGATPITSFADAAGKKFENGAGVSVTNAVEQWNEKNPDQTIDITYSDADTAVWLQHVEDGSVDFSIIDGPMYTAYVDEYGFDLGKAEIPEEEASLISDNLYAYFILPKDQTELRDKLDGAILELKQNGTLKELSEKFFGGADQSPAEDVLQTPLN